jgi:hypothetical protein
MINESTGQKLACALASGEINVFVEPDPLMVRGGKIVPSIPF